MREYIEKEAALQLCEKVLGTDTIYSIEVKRAFQAYETYLERLTVIKTTRCPHCIYAKKKTTDAGTIRYVCLFDKGWRDCLGHCENGREPGDY